MLLSSKREPRNCQQRGIKESAASKRDSMDEEGQKYSGGILF